jgi:predicted regulator of Ras-like GTPase activity (Roadblock/LC7/MglB family)
VTDQQSDTLAATLRPYRENPGIRAALLISRDGFSVAADADDTVDVTAVAAHLGGILDIGARLSRELGQQQTRHVFIELDEMTVLISPFGDELLLALVGDSESLTCDYRLRRAPA